MNKGLVLIKKLHKRQLEHSISAYSAQMAFFFMLSIFPFFIFLFTVLARFSIDSGMLIKLLEVFFPKDVHKIIIVFIKDNISLRDGRVVSISILGAIWSASKGVRALMVSLNMAYDKKETRNFFIVKLMDMLYTIFIVIAIAILLTLPSIGVDFYEFINEKIFIKRELFELFNLIKTLLIPGILVFLMCGIYMFIPNIKLTFKEVIWGALFSILGWGVLSYGFAIFLNNFANFKVVYGSLTTVIILMFWLYFSSMLLIFGGEINSIIKEINNESKK